MADHLHKFTITAEPDSPISLDRLTLDYDWIDPSLANRHLAYGMEFANDQIDFYSETREKLREQQDKILLVNTDGIVSEDSPEKIVDSIGQNIHSYPKLVLYSAELNGNSLRMHKGVTDHDHVLWGSDAPLLDQSWRDRMVEEATGHDHPEDYYFAKPLGIMSMVVTSDDQILYGVRSKYVRVPGWVNFIGGLARGDDSDFKKFSSTRLADELSVAAGEIASSEYVGIVTRLADFHREAMLVVRLNVDADTLQGRFSPERSPGSWHHSSIDFLDGKDGAASYLAEPRKETVSTVLALLTQYQKMY